jgi:hypothetical protein
MPAASDFFIVAVCCGHSTTLCLSDGGGVIFTGSMWYDKAPFGRPKDADPKVPYQLRNLPRIREMAISLMVPLTLPGMPFATMVEATAERPGEVATFWAADEPTVFAWGSPGGLLPRVLKLPAAGDSAANSTAATCKQNVLA